MWKWLIGGPRKQYPPIDHPRLGTLTFDQEEESWVAQAALPTVRLLIVGDPQPDERLIAHAVEVVDSFARLEADVEALLREAADARPKFAEEIRRLAISDVCLLWPDRPADAMIYFSGPDKYRVWRCDYVSGHPQSLGFDS